MNGTYRNGSQLNNIVAGGGSKDKVYRIANPQQPSTSVAGVERDTD